MFQVEKLLQRTSSLCLSVCSAVSVKPLTSCLMTLVAEMPALERMTDEFGNHISWLFWCPGCRTHHSFCVQRGPAEKGPVWEFNNNLDRPTFSPSLLCWGSRPDLRCHLFLRDGKIQYLSDCSHSLKDTVVDLDLTSAE